MTIEQLPRYERLPGEYYVLRVTDCKEASDLLNSLGIGAWLEYHRADPSTEHVMTNGMYRSRFIRPGDFITFRRDESKPSGWSVITYAKADFESRYQRATPPCT